MIVGKPFTVQLFTAGLATLAVALTLGHGVAAQGFKFSNEDPALQASKDAKTQRQARVQAQLDTPCRAQIKNQKIMVVIGEERNGVILANQSHYSPHINAINDRLAELDLKTFTQAQIRAQIAQAEIDAFFKNDPNAAAGAAKRLAAQYILRGVISTSARKSAIVNVNQVNVAMNFTLTGANGRMISNAAARNESYAGADVSGMALTLVNESAQEVVAQLYSDYCLKAGAK